MNLFGKGILAKTSRNIKKRNGEKESKIGMFLANLGQIKIPRETQKQHRIPVSKVFYTILLPE